MQRTEKTDNIENSNIRKYQLILETSTISKFDLKYVIIAQNILQNASNTVIFHKLVDTHTNILIKTINKHIRLYYFTKHVSILSLLQKKNTHRFIDFSM